MSDPAQPSLRLRVAAAPIGQTPTAQAIVLSDAPVAIGRGDDNDLMLPDPLASCRAAIAGSRLCAASVSSRTAAPTGLSSTTCL